MTLHQIVQRRRDALLAAFRTDAVPPLVAVESRAALVGLRSLPEFADSTDRNLGRRGPERVFFLQSGSDPDRTASLWVQAGYGDYCAAYAAFLRTVYGLVVQPRELGAYDVDHLLNRKRAASGSVLLRIEALPPGQNRAWGSLLERIASSADIAKNRTERRLMSTLIAAKVAGLPPPRSSSDHAAIARIADTLAGPHLSAAQLRDGVVNMLTHMERNQP